MDPARSYINLDLWVERRGSAPVVYTIRGRSRQLDLNDLATCDATGLGAGDAKLEDDSADAEYIKALGARQHQFLFKTTEARIRSLLDRCLGAAGEDCGVRIRLQLGDLNPEIAAIPWEFLYAESEGGFLASSVRTPVVRYILPGDGPSEVREPEARLPFNLLVVIPAVPDLDVDEEKRRIREALEGINPPVAVDFLEDVVTRERLNDKLNNESYDFVHFIAHGDFQEGKGRLRLNENALDPDWIDDQALSELIKNHTSIKLVVLNTCRGAEMSTSRAFAGLAPQLVIHGRVPAVVAMQYPISDDQALAFVHAFYHALFQGAGRGSVDAAITSARSALNRDFPGKRAVGLPVLFTRYDEGVLFTVVTDRAGRKPASLKPSERARDEAIRDEATRALDQVTDPAERETQRGIKERAEARIRYRNRAIAGSVAIFVAVILALMAGLFDRLRLAWIVAASPIWFGDPLASKLPVDSIVLVTAQTPRDSTWRSRDARLISRLAQAGARVVSFDVRFRVENPVDDPVLADAVRAARERNTAVVGGANMLQADSLALASRLRNLIAPGMDCLGENSKLFSGIVPLVWAKGDEREMLPSLALATVKAWRGTTATVDPSGKTVLLVDSRAQVVDQIRLTKVTHLLFGQSGCAIMTAGSRYGEMLAVRAPIATWRDPRRHFDYEAVLAMPAEQLGWAKNKIVLVGATVEKDAFERVIVLRKDRRYGVERHADAIATILGNLEPRPVGPLMEYLLVAGLTGIAAVLAYRTPRPRRLHAALMALAVFGGLAALSIVLYRSGHLLLNLLYPMLAFLLTFAFLLRLRRRWLP